MSAPEPATVVVHRRVGLLAGVGGAASVVAGAYVVRATGTHAVLDWAVGSALGVVALVYAALLVDARSPLLVVDERGARTRRGRRWQAVPWSEVRAVEVVPPASWWRDGRLALETEDGGVIAARLGLATGSMPAVAALDAALVALSGRPLPDAEPGPTDDASTATQDDEPAGGLRHWPDPRPRLAAGIGTLAARLPRPRIPTRAVPQTHGALALAHELDTEPLPELAELRRGDVDLLPAEDTEPAAQGDPHATQVLPVSDPVVGPVLVAARQRLSLSVTQVAERTRIPVRVVQAVEADDFSRCGGDFYARGHLRTLGRVLGIDAAPLVAAYDERYAQAPPAAPTVIAAIADPAETAPPRRQATSWSVVVAAVMAVVLAWSLARLALDQPTEPTLPPGLSNGSGGVHRAPTVGGAAVPVLLRAAGGGARVSVRDGNDKLVFTGDLAFGATRSLSVRPPVRIQTSDGSLEVVVDGSDRGALGDVGRPASGTFLGAG